MAKREAVGSEACAEAARICACFNVRRTARAVTRLYDEALQPSGLRSTQFVMLVSIHAHGRIGLPGLAAEMGLDRSAVTRRLKTLEREGLVRVSPSPAAGPSQVALTAKGRRKLERTTPLWQAVQDRFEAELGKRRWRGMLDDLGAAHAAAQKA